MQKPLVFCITCLVLIIILLESQDVLDIFVRNESSDPHKMKLGGNICHLLLPPNVGFLVEFVNATNKQYYYLPPIKK